MTLAQEVHGLAGMRAADVGFIRSHYTVKTQHSNKNLVKYVQNAVPGWKMLAPPEAVIVPSNFSNVDGERSLDRAKSLSS